MSTVMIHPAATYADVEPDERARLISPHPLRVFKAGT